VLVAIAAISKPSGLLVARRNALLLAIAGIALAVHFATWIASLEYTTVAVSTLLVATSPIWTALYDTLVHKRPLTPLARTGFVTGGIGLWLIVGFNRTQPPVPGHVAFGAGLALIGALAIAAYFLLVREVRGDLDTRVIVTHTYSWAALALVVAAAIARQGPPHLDNVASWSGILAMALVSQLLGHTAMNASLRWFTPSAVSFSTLLEPVVAAVAALVVFGERIAPAAIAGAAILLVSLAVVLREEPLAEANR